MRRLTHAVGGALLDGEKKVGSPLMANRKSADAPGPASRTAWQRRPGRAAGFPHALATIATAASRPTARRVCRLTERPRACSGRRDITGSARGRGRRVEGFNEIDRP
jgi:hypothetical protein